MYYSLFGLKENPFKPTPDPRYLYLSRGHQEALDHLAYGIGERKGFVLITGGVGTGKTTLLRSLLADLDSSVKTALVINPFVSEDDLLPTICEEFGVPTPEADTKKAWLDALNAFLLSTHASGGNAVLLLDEAQNFSRDVLEQVRILSNLETQEEKLLQIVLVGQEELGQALALPELRQLNDRIVVRYQLGPLDAEDVSAYVQHRMSKAGCKSRLPFTAPALDALYQVSSGNPRKINAICDRALLAAFTKNERKVGPEGILDAAGEVVGAGAPMPTPRQPKKRLGGPGLLAAALWGLLAIAVIAAFLRPAPAPVSVSVAAPPRVAPPAAPPALAVAEVKAPAVEQRVPDPFAPIFQKPPASAQDREARQIEDSLQAPVSAQKEVLVAEVSPPQAETTLDPAVGVQRKNIAGQGPSPDAAPAWLLGPEKSLALLLSQAEDGEGESGVFSFHASLAGARLFRRPFRAAVTDPATGKKGFIVIVSQISAGFVVSDSSGGHWSLSEQDLSPMWEGSVLALLPPRLADRRLKPGSRGADVLWVQQTLHDAGYTVEPDGVYGPQTLRAIRLFQRDFRITDDGVVDFRTWGMLHQLNEPGLTG